jgi:Flp pilus assembly protein CpaB
MYQWSVNMCLRNLQAHHFALAGKNVVPNMDVDVVMVAQGTMKRADGEKGGAIGQALIFCWRVLTTKPQTSAWGEA